MMMAKILWDTMLVISGSLFTFGSGQNNSTSSGASISSEKNSTLLQFFSTNSSSMGSPSTQTTTIATSTAGISPIKKFVAAAVRSHFDDCPDSHRHFCFHGTCRFLILEETPACVCHQGFVGVRCEHADLLAVVATKHSQNTFATVLVFCVISCVLIAVLVTVLHCWWRQLRRRRRYAHRNTSEKNSGASYWPTESVVWEDAVKTPPLVCKTSNLQVVSRALIRRSHWLTSEVGLERLIQLPQNRTFVFLPFLWKCNQQPWGPGHSEVGGAQFGVIVVSDWATGRHHHISSWGTVFVNDELGTGCIQVKGQSGFMVLNQKPQIPN